MKIAMAQTNPVIGDFRCNGEKIRQFAEKAKIAGCDLVVFPELAISGYPPGDLLEKTDFVNAQLAELDQLSRSIHGIGILLGVATRQASGQGKGLYNSAVLVEDGKVLVQVEKQLLPTYDIFDESRYFKPGAASEPFKYKGYRLGITICEDVWNYGKIPGLPIYDHDPVSELYEKGVDLLINIAASPFHSGKQVFRMGMLQEISRQLTVPLVFVNQVGGNDSTIFDGLSCAVSSNGQLASLAADFKEDLVTFSMDSGAGEIHDTSNSKIEALVKALVSGTQDYILKSGFSKAIIGSSGGIDSALTTVIAVEALGKENVVNLFMPSPYTSAKNFEDTKVLAENLGIAYKVIPIMPMYESFLSLFDDVDIHHPGITEQNLQARIRGTILMAHSNKTGSILLATGNKSEMAVGYATLYGDMCGGLAVIGDLPKQKVYEAAEYVNRNREIIPRSIIEKVPSAELAPGQTDQDDLPPYDIIDAVVKGYIEDHKSLAEFESMGLEGQVVEQIIKRINKNEYKRYQAPPILRVTSKAFGPGRRHPMVQRFMV